MRDRTLFRRVAVASGTFEIKQKNKCRYFLSVLDISIEIVVLLLGSHHEMSAETVKILCKY